ncbi:hypothetical protein Tco_0270243 [Tanacetum coccineum]
MPTITQPSSSQPQKKHKPRKPKKKDTQIPQSIVPSNNLADEAINEENVSKHSNDPLLSSLGEEDASKLGRKIHDIDADEDITLENVYNEDMFGVNDLEGDKIVVESEVGDKDVNLSVDEVTLAQALAALKSAKTLAKGIIFHEQEQAPTPIVSSQQPTQVKDKGKGKMVEEEPVKKMSKKELLKLDEELALKLQAKEDEEERYTIYYYDTRLTYIKRLAREKAQKFEEANIAWDDIQAKVEADYQLAQRLQAQEQEELSDADKATLFVQLLE